MCPVFCTLIGLIAVLCLVASFLPKNFTVSRSATIVAPAAAVFPHVNGLRNWGAWSPWKKLDPSAKETFEGPAEGVGARMSWAGSMKVGEGSMTVEESRPAEFVKIKLDFLKPMKSTSTAEFRFKPEGGNTLVTWSMTGERNFMAKLMSIFISCEKMVGGNFEKGLVSLKEVAEAKK